jgi:hypothetical protein
MTGELDKMQLNLTFILSLEPEEVCSDGSEFE